MELLKTLFESAELPTEFKEKTATLFEAAVDEKVKSELVTMQESYETKLTADKQAFITESVALIDTVVEETVLEWAKENAVGLDTEIKGQIAESFLQGLKAVFEKADIELSGDTAGKELKKLQEQNATLAQEAADAKQALVEAKQTLDGLKIKEIVEQLTEGLADTQAHRVAKLCEAFEFKSEEDYRAKVALVVEAVGGSIKGTQNADGTIIAVDGEGKVSNTVDTSAGAAGPEDGELLNKPGGAENASAEGATGEGEKKSLKETYEQLQTEHAPHLHSDMVAETLKLFR